MKINQPDWEKIRAILQDEIYYLDDEVCIKESGVELIKEEFDNAISQERQRLLEEVEKIIEREVERYPLLVGEINDKLKELI